MGENFKADSLSIRQFSCSLGEGGGRVEREICSLHPIPLLSLTRHGKAAEVPVFLNHARDMFLTNSCLTVAVGGQHCNVSLVQQVVVKPQALEEPCTLPRT